MTFFTSIDIFRHINLKTLSAGGLGSILAAWVLSNHVVFTVCLFAIGTAMLFGGEWYAKEIYDNPIKPTYKSVIIGNLILGAGISTVSILINLTGVSQWLQPIMWLWCIALCGGPQIYWQQLKDDEQKAKANKTVDGFRDELKKD